MAKTNTRPRTIHEEAREQFELAMSYAEDGAIQTAATMIAEIAHEYQRRANLIKMEMDAARQIED